MNWENFCMTILFILDNFEHVFIGKKGWVIYWTCGESYSLFERIQRILRNTGQYGKRWEKSKLRNGKWNRGLGQIIQR